MHRSREIKLNGTVDLRMSVFSKLSKTGLKLLYVRIIRFLNHELAVVVLHDQVEDSLRSLCHCFLLLIEFFFESFLDFIVDIVEGPATVYLIFYQHASGVMGSSTLILDLARPYIQVLRVGNIPDSSPHFA